VRVLRASAVVTLLAAGACAGEPHRPAPPAIAPSSAPTGPPPARCPIVPLELVVTVDRAVPVLALDASGGLTAALAGASPVATLTDGGCLRGRDGVWAELTPSEAIWTLRTIYRLEDGWIVSDVGRAWRVRPDGAVEIRDARGAIEPGSQLRFDGFRPEAACAANLVLVTFLGMAPSMAVSDGNPREMAPPPDSVCR
jgi:hypothetical protein